MDDQQKQEAQKFKEQATRCRRNHICLNDGKPLCQVERKVGEVIFVNLSPDAYCDYRIPFGNSYLCSCPVHKALAAQ